MRLLHHESVCTLVCVHVEAVIRPSSDYSLNEITPCIPALYSREPLEFLRALCADVLYIHIDIEVSVCVCMCYGSRWVYYADNVYIQRYGSFRKDEIALSLFRQRQGFVCDEKKKISTHER